MSRPDLFVEVMPGWPYREGVFTLDVSELDGPDYLDWGGGADEEGWVDVTCDVMSVGIRRGASRVIGPLTTSEYGAADLVIRDTARMFDPFENADAIHRNVPARIRAEGPMGGAFSPEFSAEFNVGGRWSSILFTGRIGDISVDYAQAGAPVVELEVLDIIARLSVRQAFTQLPVGTGDDLLDRVTRVAELLPPRSDDTSNVDDLASDDAYTATLTGTSYGKSALELMTDAQLAELGRVWANRDDRLVVRGRRSQLAGPVRGTLSDIHYEDGGGEFAPHCCYSTLTATLDADVFYNDVIAGREVDNPPDGYVPARVRVYDPDSDALYGPGRLEQTDLRLLDDLQLLPWAQDLVGNNSIPTLRVSDVTPVPDNHEPAWPAICATDIGDRWIVHRHPGGNPILVTVGVLGISHDITPDSWSVQLRTEQAPDILDPETGGWFTLDVSELDGDDVLFPGSEIPA